MTHHFLWGSLFLSDPHWKGCPNSTQLLLVRGSPFHVFAPAISSALLHQSCPTFSHSPLGDVILDPRSKTPDPPYTHILPTCTRTGAWKACIHTCFDSPSFLCLLLTFFPYWTGMKHCLFISSIGSGGRLNAWSVFVLHSHPGTVFAVGSLKMCWVNCPKGLLAPR